MADSKQTDLATFESHRATLVSLAYRMLGDLARAEDMVQEAWVRWQSRTEKVDSPRAYLVTITTRLCLNELGSAKTRKEESRDNRLPEPVALEVSGLDRVEALEHVSMAFMVVLQRLTPPERAVLLLHDVFDFGHDEIASLVGKSNAACRKLLERARENVAAEKRMFSAPSETHKRLLGAFMQAVSSGDLDALTRMLSEDAVLITDGGAAGSRGFGLRNLKAPLHGVAGIAAFLVETAKRASAELELVERELNGQPAMVFYRDGAPLAAMLLGVVDGRIHRIFFHADSGRLQHLGTRN